MNRDRANKVVYVEPDVEMRTNMIDVLEDAGFSATGFRTAEEASLNLMEMR